MSRRPPIQEVYTRHNYDLVSSLRDASSICDVLVNDRIFSRQNADEVRCRSTTCASNSKLIDILETRGLRGLKSFLWALDITRQRELKDRLTDTCARCNIDVGIKPSPPRKEVPSPHHSSFSPLDPPAVNSHPTGSESTVQRGADDNTNDDRDTGSNSDDHNVCSVCMDRKPDVCLLPCRHKTTCSQCTNALNPRVCPICRQAISRTIALTPVPTPRETAFEPCNHSRKLFPGEVIANCPVCGVKVTRLIKMFV